MKSKSISGLPMLALASFGLAIAAPTEAFAETAEVQSPSPFEHRANAPSPRDDAIGADFFGVEEKVQNLFFTRPDWLQLRNEGVLIKEPFLRTELQAVAAEHGWASRKMLGALDKYSKEGTAISVYRFTGGEGITLVQNLKGTDIAANCFRVAGWSLARDSNGRMMYNNIVCGENWQTILAKTGTAAIGSALAGSAVAAVSNATAPRHEGDTWFIQGGRGGEGGSALANAQQTSRLENNTQTTVTFEGLANCGAGQGC